MSYEEIDDSGRRVTVRKDHRCSWCSESVPKGSLSVRRVYMWEGDFTDERMHPECFDAMHRDSPDDGWSPGDMLRGMSYEEMHEVSP